MYLLWQLQYLYLVSTHFLANFNSRKILNTILNFEGFLSLIEILSTALYMVESSTTLCYPSVKC